MEHYILTDTGEVQPADNPEQWIEWFSANTDARRVARTQVEDVEVSTVFLGIDHQWSEGPPLLFETMIFGDAHDEYQWRWTTRVQALAGHDQVVTALRNGDSPASIR